MNLGVFLDNLKIKRGKRLYYDEIDIIYKCIMTIPEVYETLKKINLKKSDLKILKNKWVLLELEYKSEINLILPLLSNNFFLKNFLKLVENNNENKIEKNYEYVYFKIKKNKVVLYFNYLENLPKENNDYNIIMPINSNVLEEIKFMLYSISFFFPMKDEFCFNSLKASKDDDYYKKEIEIMKRLKLLIIYFYRFYLNLDQFHNLPEIFINCRCNYLYLYNNNISTIDDFSILPREINCLVFDTDCLTIKSFNNFPEIKSCVIFYNDKIDISNNNLIMLKNKIPVFIFPEKSQYKKNILRSDFVNYYCERVFTFDIERKKLNIKRIK